MASVVRRTVKLEKFIWKVRKQMFVEFSWPFLPLCYLSFCSFTPWLDSCAFCVFCFPSIWPFHLILVTARRLKEGGTYASFWPLTDASCAAHRSAPVKYSPTTQPFWRPSRPWVTTGIFWPLSRETSINPKHERLQNVEKYQVSGDLLLTEVIIISKVAARTCL